MNMNNPYKLICIDVDGTLYNDQKVIPTENITAIQEAAARGILVAITTGRMYHYGHLYGGMLGIDSLTIASNGASSSIRTKCSIIRRCLRRIFSSSRTRSKNRGCLPTTIPGMLWCAKAISETGTDTLLPTQSSRRTCALRSS